MRVHIGSDHAGLELKSQLVDTLTSQGHDVTDHGPHAYDAEDDYPVFCLRAGSAVVADAGSLGIVIGGSGNGEQIAANKVKGVRAALAWSDETARLGRMHNDANVVSIGARMHSVDEAVGFVETFLATAFTGEERHVRRLGMLTAYEQTGDLPPAAGDLNLSGSYDMPEGHTLFRLAADLREAFLDRPVHASSPQGRFVDEARLVDGHPLASSESAGKHLFLTFADDRIVHVHLGLIGVFAIGAAPVPEPVGAVRLRLENDTAYADLRGATTCVLIDGDERDTILAKLGPDPLRADADPERAFARIHKSRKAIGALLMDQSVLAGVGNVYRAETLFRARLSPLTPGQKVSRRRWTAMWDDLVDLMAYGVGTGRIDTVRDEHTPEAMGRPPRVDDHGGEVYVYRRTGQPCHVCGSIVKTKVLDGRNLFWCPTCQRRR